jgi:hypothetical protein
VCEIPISQITRAKWTRNVDQVVESLLCKCKALSSNPSATKEKEKKDKVTGVKPRTEGREAMQTRDKNHRGRSWQEEGDMESRRHDCGQ